MEHCEIDSKTILVEDIFNGLCLIHRGIYENPVDIYFKTLKDL